MSEPDFEIASELGKSEFIPSQMGHVVSNTHEDGIDEMIVVVAPESELNGASTGLAAYIKQFDS